MTDNAPPIPFVFILMPFKDEFRDVYESGIKPACEAAGVYCERIDDQKFDETILERIYNQIESASVIVADMTGCNPNVFYEVGYAHALHKRVILVTRDVNDIPFDLSHHRHIEYKGKSYVLKRQLIDELKGALQRQPYDLDQEVDSWLVRSIVGRIVRILGQVSRSVAGQSEMQPLVEGIIEEVTEILEAEAGSIFLNEAGSPDVITCVAGHGFARAIVGRAQYRAGEGFTGRVFQRGQTAVVGSNEDLEKLRQRDEFQGRHDAEQWAAFGGVSQFRNGIAAPLKIGDQPVGVIKVENKRSGNFTGTDVAILEAITNGVLSVAIQNARLLQKSRSQTAGRWRRISLIKEFLDRNPNPIEPGFVFALLPDETKDIYERYVRKAAESLDLRCESLLDLKSSGNELQNLLLRMQKAEILIYDITDLNPDIMWQLGLGLAIKDAERVIVIGAESAEGSLEIDIHRLTFRYNPNSVESLDELYKTLREVMLRINKVSSRKPFIQSPEVKSLLDNALKAVGRKEWIAAEALFQTMDVREPKNWYIYNQWGIMLRTKGDEFEAAYDRFVKALAFAEFDDEKAFIYTEIAVLLQIDRRYSDAEDWFRKAEKADSENNRLYIAWADYYDELHDYFSAQAKIGGALARMGKGREGDPSYQELLLRHDYYSRKIRDASYKRTFEQFKREVGLPAPAMAMHSDVSGDRLPYNLSWEELVDNHVGAVVEGEISNITSEHGIFVRLSRDFTGLIFWKNLDEGFAEKFSRNQKVKVRISKAFINDRDQRGRIDLRLVE